MRSKCLCARKRPSRLVRRSAGARRRHRLDELAPGESRCISETVIPPTGDASFTTLVTGVRDHAKVDVRAIRDAAGWHLATTKLEPSDDAPFGVASGSSGPAWALRATTESPDRSRRDPFPDVRSGRLSRHHERLILRPPSDSKPDERLFAGHERCRFAISAIRIRRALSLMKPPASAWSYAPPSSSKVAMFWSNSVSFESRATTVTPPL